MNVFPESEMKVMNATEFLADMIGSGTDDQTNETPDEDAVEMQNFIARCPNGEILVNRRSVDRPAFKFVVVGYEQNTRELGVFHWTSSDSKARLKGVITGNLKKAEERGAALVADDIHVLEAEAVDEVPEGALTFKRGQRHFMPLPQLSLEERLENLREKLQSAETDEARERLEERITKLEERIVKANLRAEAEIEKALAEATAEDTFRLKKEAVAAARERGLSQENVVKNDAGEWVIVVR